MVCPPSHYNYYYITVIFAVHVVTTIIRLRNNTYPSGCVGTLKERALPVFCSFTKKVIGQLVAAFNEA